MSKSKAILAKNLSSEAYHIMHEKGTEIPFSGKLLYEKRGGSYSCANCGAELFSSSAKYDSGSGWPSFTSPLSPKKIISRIDRSYEMTRVEVACASCGAHLGHVFEDGPKDSGGQRYCINSISLDFKEVK